VSDGDVGLSQLFTGSFSRFSMSEHSILRNNGGFRDLHSVISLAVMIPFTCLNRQYTGSFSLKYRRHRSYLRYFVP